MGVLSGAGLRRAEVVALNLQDYDKETGALIVRGKGNKQQGVGYIDDGAAEAMETWITARGEEPGRLFCPITQRGEVIIRSITDQAVYSILQDSGH